MPVNNAAIASRLNELADLLEIEEANPFRVRAYRNAAFVISGLSQDVADMVAEGRDLTELPGIGKDLADKISTLAQTGILPMLEEVKQEVPEALRELMRISGLGPKRIHKLYDTLHVRNADELMQAAQEGRVHEIPGFGLKTEQQILAGAEKLTTEEKRLRLADAEPVAHALVRYLEKTPEVIRVEVAGSFRRRKETVGDLDVLVIARPDSPVMERFTRYEEVADILSQGPTRSTVILKSGLQVDLRDIPEESYGAALHYFTGSKAHNIAVRTLALRRGLKINEYGIFNGEKRVAGREEADVYAAVGLPWIVPELREDRGEIEAAQAGRLPKLIELSNIRGDLHMHTNATDGRYTLEEMARRAAELGYEYIAITDHTRHLTVAHGMDPRRLAEQIDAIDRLNDRLGRPVILKGSEVDILEDGTLDLPGSILKRLDLTVCSVHYKFDLPQKQQTERIIRAMDNPYFNIFGHPSGRLINRRPPYEVDMEAIMAAAKARGCFLELDSQPARLDLADIYCKHAKELGVKISISTDAHTLGDLKYMRFGIDQARRGWLEAGDVLNTYPLAQLKKMLHRT